LEDLKGKDHLGDPDVDRRIILKWILKKTECNDVDWIYVTEGRD
jgi:hypothetical protein